MSDGEYLLVTGALLAAGLGVALVAGRVRLPGLVLVLGLGMAIGSDGTGWIPFEDYELARTIGVVALALILFEGGLAAGWGEIRPVLGPAVALAVLGTTLTAVLSGLAAAAIFDLSTLEGMLLGSILAATDGAAVFAILRGSTLRRRVARTLEGEAGFNDPVAVLLVLGFVEWIENPDYGPLDLAGSFVVELGIGLAVGLAAGALGVLALRRVTLASAGLYPVASLALVALAYGGADVLHGSGFLAVYLAGLAVGSASGPFRRTVELFHDGLAWVAQIALFLTLGLLVFPAQLDEVALRGTLLALVVAVVARPLATFVSMLPFRFSAADQVVLGWAGLRGAVPVVLATFPVIAEVPGSQEFFNLVFFAVVISTVLQATTFVPLAERLGATTDEAAVPAPLMEPTAVRRLGAESVEFVVRDGDAVAGRRVRELGLPRDALLNLVVRHDTAIPPRGSTRIEPGDRLAVLVRQEVAVEFRELLRRWRSGPLPEVQDALTGPRGSTQFSTGPWREEHGDPGKPDAVVGVGVVDRLRTRRDRPGALVALADGRVAFTGPVLAIGPPRAVQGAARDRLRWARDESERAWWREVIGALAGPS